MRVTPAQCRGCDVLALWEPLSIIADCLCQEVEQATGTRLCWCGLTPGAGVPYEYCGECGVNRCGVGYVAFDGALLQNEFLAGPQRCANPVQMQIRVGVLRCYPLPEDGGTADPDVLQEMVALVTADMHAARRAMLCCYEGDVTVQQYTVLGPEGGCVGGEWSAYVPLDV